MWVQFATSVPSGYVDLGQVANPGDLDVVGCLDEVCAGYGAVRDKTGAVAGFEAPGDFDALGVADDGVGSWVRRGKDAEIVHGVY